MVKCTYCGEFEANRKISNPNAGTTGFWDVCENCEKIIECQMGISFGHVMKMHIRKEMPDNKELLKDMDKLIEKEETKLENISHEAGLETFMARFEMKKNDKRN